MISRVAIKATEEQKAQLIPLHQYITFTDTAPDIDISKHTSISAPEILENEMIALIWSYVRAANYMEATNLAFMSTAMWPSNPVHSFHWASLYLDTYRYFPFPVSQAEGLTLAKKCLTESLFALKKDSVDYFRCRNEFFFNTAQYKKQYLNGKNMARVSTNGLYAAGVGASSFLSTKLKLKNLFTGRVYAKRAVQCLEDYLILSQSNYYNAYIHLARAQFFLGNGMYKKTIKRSIDLGAPEGEVRALLVNNRRNFIFFLLSKIMN